MPNDDGGEWTRDMIAIIDGIIELLERETASLSQGRMAEIGPLQEQKATLTVALQEQLQALRRDPALGEAGDGLRQALREREAALGDALLANAAALRGAGNASQRLLALVTRAARERLGNPGYTREGSAAAGPAAGRRDVLSVAVDRTL